MAANKLVINEDKLHLVVFANKSHGQEKEKVRIQAGAYIISPSEHEKLLGCHIAGNLKWNKHIMDKLNYQSIECVF